MDRDITQVVEHFIVNGEAVHSPSHGWGLLQILELDLQDAKLLDEDRRRLEELRRGLLDAMRSASAAPPPSSATP